MSELPCTCDVLLRDEHEREVHEVVRQVRGDAEVLKVNIEELLMLGVGVLREDVSNIHHVLGLELKEVGCKDLIEGVNEASSFG